MRQVRFIDPAGSTRRGRWSDEGIVFGNRVYDPESVSILPPSEPTKIVCVGLNYTDHAAETDSDIPERPLLFFKTPNTIAGHGDVVRLPEGRRIDYEAELGVVIGTQCRNVAPADAMDVVAGYTCVDDLSNRDDQRDEQNWVRGKAFDNAAPMGPVLAPPDAVPDDASIELRVNGAQKQGSTIDNLIFDVPDLIAEITDLLTLEPGDVIATGTPAGVGPLDDEDVVEVEIEGIGTLRHEVRTDTTTDDVTHDFMPDQ